MPHGILASIRCRGFVRNALIIVVALGSAGCGPSGRESKPVTRHLVYKKLVGERGIWIADVDGSRARLLVHGAGRTPEISPDGTTVAYLDGCSGGGIGPCNLYTVPSSGGRPKLLAAGISPELTWSPDSERIAAGQSGPDGAAALVSIDVSTGRVVTLTRGALFGWSFSPDSGRIVFARAEPNPDAFSVSDYKVDLFVADPEGGGSKRITESGDAGYPVWGPESIAFAKLVPYDGWGRNEIWRIAPDGTGPNTITGRTPERLLGKGYEGLIPIEWSDDGSALLGSVLDEGGTRWFPFAVDPETGRLRELGGSKTVLKNPALSRDGRYALVELESTDGQADFAVGIVPYASGRPRIVARGAVGPSWNR